MIRQTISNLWRNVRHIFGQYRAEEHGAYQYEHENKTKRRNFPRSYYRESRRQRMIDWCADYNARNGGIIPPVSVESIYRKAHAR